MFTFSKYKKISIILCLIFCSCCKNETTQTFFITTKTNTQTIKSNKNNSNIEIEWFIQDGHARIDSTAKGKHLLSLHPNKKTLSMNMHLNTIPMNLSEFNIYDIELYGDFLIKKSDQSEIIIKFDEFSNQNKHKNDSIIISHSTIDNDWKHFSLNFTPSNSFDYLFCSINFKTSKIEDELIISNLGIKINKNEIENLLSYKFPAQIDNRFNKESGIEITKMTAFKKETLLTIGKIWGFLKYYHPNVTSGEYNIDYELFHELKNIDRITSKNERNDMIINWVNRLGDISNEYHNCAFDSLKYSQIIDLNWLSNTEIFDNRTIEVLNKTANAKRSNKFNYYIPSINPTIKANRFNRESDYKNITWTDQGYRLLTLYRIWNFIEYCYPYKGLLNCNWDDVMQEFILDFLFPENEMEFKISILKLCSQINDSHINLKYENKIFRDYIFSKHFRTNKIFKNAQLVKTCDNNIVVKNSFYPNLKNGDIIKSVNGENIYTIIDSLKPFFSLSNNNDNYIYEYILSTTSDSLQIECIRDTSIVNVTLTKEPFLKKYKLKSWRDYELNKKNIVYIKGDTNLSDQPTLSDAAGVIIDMRTYGNDHFFLLEEHLTNSNIIYAWTSENDKNRPGSFKLKSKQNFGKHNKTTYNGKVIILVDENTISRSETMTMAFASIPNAIVIGNTSAGANGNVITLPLLYGIELNLPVLGFYYPNWNLVQKKGVKIDVLIEHTLNNTKAGSDPWIEKAIELIMNHK